MARGLWGKIEAIREQPEHIRMRYVIGCLAVSMFFIVGIWLLSLGESFQSIGSDVPAAAQRGKDLLPKDQPSLGDLIQSAKPLQADSQSGQTNADYFNEQFQKGTAETGSGGN
jgi:hypothetical protein